MQQYLWMTTYEVKDKYGNLKSRHINDYVTVLREGLMELQKRLEDIHSGYIVVMYESKCYGLIDIESAHK